MGFDWPDLDGVFAKVDEEIGELKEAVQAFDAEALEDEMGDIFLAMVNLARHLDVDAEAALRKANSRFEGRFRLMEAAAAEEGSRLQEENLEQLERRWQTAKCQLSTNNA